VEESVRKVTALPTWLAVLLALPSPIVVVVAIVATELRARRRLKREEAMQRLERIPPQLEAPSESREAAETAAEGRRGTPRTYPPAPGWSSDGHRIKAPLEYGRGTEKVWVYGALRVRDGKALTLSAPSRNTKGYLRLLEAVAQANPTGDLYLITDSRFQCD
jgi:hypothetical protein